MNLLWFTILGPNTILIVRLDQRFDLKELMILFLMLIDCFIKLVVASIAA